MTRLSVICPSAPWENETTDEDRAWDLCLSLSEEYGYAQVRQDGRIVGEYRDGLFDRQVVVDRPDAVG